MSDLTAEHVSKSYPTRTEPLEVLRDVSIQLSSGQNVAILGPSGSGKSTLLHILGGLDPPTSGTVVLGRENPYLLDATQLARYRNRHIGFIFQEHFLLPQLSVLENVLIPTLARGRPTAELVARAGQLLDKVGLSKRLEHRPAELSGGERQRAAVARSLINSPLLLLADEPTGSLDRTNAQAVGQLMLDLQRQEQTILVVVTHSLELAGLMQRRLELDDGQLRN